MYHPFVRRGSRTRRASWLSASIVVHALVIVAAIRATPEPGAPWRGWRRHTSESVTYIHPSEYARVVLPLSMLPGQVPAASPTPVEARGTDGGAVKRRSTPAPSPLAGLATIAAALALEPLPIDSTVAAGPDLAVLATSPSDFGDAGERFLRTMLARAYAGASPGVTYAESAVDRAVAPLRANPKPRYPRALADAGVEDSLEVQFVVDTTGRVDERSMSFPHNAERLFVASVREALMHSRYFPAQLGGQRVRQVVQQRFVFMLRR